MSIDSRFAEQYNGGDTSDFTIRLPSTYRNIARIALSSVELPQVEFLFSVCHGNLNMSVSGNTRNIAPGNYNACSLVTAVNEQLQDISSALHISLSPITGSVCITGTSPFTIDLRSSNTIIAARNTHWGLGYYLGFRQKGPLTAVFNPLTGFYEVCATAVILTQATPYYLLQLWCPEFTDTVSHRVYEGGFVSAFAKLVLRGGFYILQALNNSDYMRKEYTFLSPKAISHFRIKLLDPFGNPVDLRGMDWSLTFELYEIVNSRTYETLMGTYGRV